MAKTRAKCVCAERDEDEHRWWQCPVHGKITADEYADEIANDPSDDDDDDDKGSKDKKVKPPKSKPKSNDDDDDDDDTADNDDSKGSTYGSTRWFGGNSK